jgi:DNA polymerase III epsilon subunit-like protein
VRVRLLLQGQVEYPIQHHAQCALYGSLLEAGIEIHEYRPSYLHAKVAVIDSRWSTVGSSNIDPYSLLMAREMFPGKSNSLDALCKRLEVDNSKRTLHGALLDAGLLADVYVCMTRGQGTLVIDEGEPRDARGVVEQVDLAAFDLPVPEGITTTASGGHNDGNETRSASPSSSRTRPSTWRLRSSSSSQASNSSRRTGRRSRSTSRHRRAST